jgi:penicillin-binding protein 1C
LAASLNVPAVQLLSKIGIRNFSDALVSSGFRQIDKDARKLGLSMILGGCGARLEELMKLYAAFAHQGVVHDLRFTKNASAALPHAIVSEASAYLVTQILTKPGRPDLPRSFENSRNLPRIAWKTGTSYGHRDAWSIGYNATYTIGVWVGNFDGHGVPELVGAEVAAPLLFDLFNSIDTRQPKKWFQMPESVDIRFVCPESGLPPESFCSHHVMDYFIPGVSPTQKCTHLKYVFVAADESNSYCQSCLPANGYVKKLYPDFAPELIAFFNDNNIDYQHIPPHNPQCDKVFDQNSPRIVSLNENAEYYIEKGQEQQLALQSVVNGDATTVYWYLDDKLFGSCKPSEKLFFVAWPGRIKVSCQDDKGRHTDIYIKVAYY